MRCFIDTNVFLYLKDPNEPRKGTICATWLKAIQARGVVLISPQVISETFSNLLKAARDQETREQTEDFVRTLMVWCEAKLNRDVLTAAFEVRRRYQMSWWDAILIASAQDVAADILLTEDLSDGQRYGAVQAINPFRHAPEDVLGRPSRN
jgi:predicted nucleic acid-binding protein